MFQIVKMRADHVIDFAAEEFKKYFRMMMPECGDLDIIYKPDATDGFRLGLDADFGLHFEEATDRVLDDVVHIETDKNGGILAGSNSRSVLFAVYRFFKENGCRWLYPGIDGEYIPVQDIKPVTWHHKADHRFRGQCNEGAESQQCMLDTIDFYAKLEMNTYMLEFDTPYYYYDRYYSHIFNEKNRTPEPLTPINVKQWKRMCEVEIAKRGLQFHDMGHGWTAEPFGLSSADQWKASDQVIPEDVKPFIAEIDGKREFFKGVPLNTNICMSNPKARTIMAQSIADYAESHKNVTYIHVWLADASRNHCECAECQKKRPSDYYIMIMNELDEELTRRNLDTRIVFICYLDTLFAPLEERIKHSKRFALLYAPIQRTYTTSVQKEKIGETPEYVRNNWSTPVSAEENAAFLMDWKKGWQGSCFSYEYHYLHVLHRDPGMMYVSRRVFEDIKTLKGLGIEGYVEDACQRAFFPNGFMMYIYAEALRDCNCDYEQIKEDYLSHAYGEDWKAVKRYLTTISELFHYPYMEGKATEDISRGRYYSPTMAENMKKVSAVAAHGRAIAEKNISLPIRVQTVSMRLLYRHAEYCEKYAAIIMEKALDNQEKAMELWNDFCDDFGRYEYELERYLDHHYAMSTIRRILNTN